MIWNFCHLLQRDWEREREKDEMSEGMIKYSFHAQTNWQDVKDSFLTIFWNANKSYQTISCAKCNNLLLQRIISSLRLVYIALKFPIQIFEFGGMVVIIQAGKQKSTLLDKTVRITLCTIHRKACMHIGKHTYWHIIAIFVVWFVLKLDFFNVVSCLCQWRQIDIKYSWPLLLIPCQETSPVVHQSVRQYHCYSFVTISFSINSFGY